MLAWIRRSLAGTLLELDPTAQACVLSHSWPRNIPEVEGFCERLRQDFQGRLGGAPVPVSAEEVRRALGPAPEVLSRRTVLENAARALLEGATPEVPVLKAARAFKQLVLSLAHDRWGKIEACQRLGLENALQSDNHHKLFREAKQAWALVGGALDGEG